MVALMLLGDWCDFFSDDRCPEEGVVATVNVTEDNQMFPISK